MFHANKPKNTIDNAKSSPLTLAEALEMAKAAKNYTRKLIIKGATQIENNQLSFEQSNDLGQGLKDLRDMINVDMSGERSLRLFQYYENTILATAKFSLGSCMEYTFQALDYVFQQDRPMINAEIYYIAGGDHGFLVLNRDPDSDPGDPMTWGAAAVICDPWPDPAAPDSNNVYLASEYETKLKNYYFDAVKNKNCIHPFDITRHRVERYFFG